MQAWINQEMAKTKPADPDIHCFLKRIYSDLAGQGLRSHLHDHSVLGGVFSTDTAVLSLQANPNPASQQPKGGGKFQPTDKVLRKYVDKINVGKFRVRYWQNSLNHIRLPSFLWDIGKK